MTESSFFTMLQLSVFLVCLTTVLCDHGYGGGFSGAGGGFGGAAAAAGAGCKPVTSFVTNVQTVVQEEINTNIVEEKVAQVELQTSVEFATVTTENIAYVTTTVLLTDFNTHTRIVYPLITVTNTQLVYIPTLQTATLPVVQTLTHTTTEVAYSTVFTTNYITSTLTTISTHLQDSVVYDVAYETELNFVASPFTTTIVEQVQDITTETVQVQGYLPPAIIVTLDNVEYQTQVQYETAASYVTAREQVTEYQTVYRDVPVISTVTATVDCYGEAVKSGVPEGSVPETGYTGAISDSTAGSSGLSDGLLVQPGVLTNHNSEIIHNLEIVNGYNYL